MLRDLFHGLVQARWELYLWGIGPVLLNFILWECHVYIQCTLVISVLISHSNSSQIFLEYPSPKCVYVCWYSISTILVDSPISASSMLMGTGLTTVVWTIYQGKLTSSAVIQSSAWVILSYGRNLMNPSHIHAGMFTGFVFCRQPELLWVHKCSSPVMP